MKASTNDETERTQSAQDCVRLLIAGDQPRIRQSLGALITALTWRTPGRSDICIEIVGEAHDQRSVVAQIGAVCPDVILLDIPSQIPTIQAAQSASMPDNLAAIQVTKGQWPAIRIVVLATYATDRAAILLAGADAFLLKGCPTGELLDAVLAVEH